MLFFSENQLLKHQRETGHVSLEPQHSGAATNFGGSFSTPTKDLTRFGTQPGTSYLNNDLSSFGGPSVTIEEPQLSAFQTSAYQPLEYQQAYQPPTTYQSTGYQIPSYSSDMRSFEYSASTNNNSYSSSSKNKGKILLKKQVVMLL
jgi:hypothetical protein